VFSSVCMQVRLDRFTQDHRHRAGDLDVVGGDRGAVLRVADHHASEAATEILQVGAQRQRRHHLRRGGDVEARLPRHPVEPGAESGDDVAQRAVVDVDRPSPGDLVRVEARRVAVEHVRVDGGGAHVGGRGDGVHVAGEVEVEQLHRHHLAVAAACRATLDAERRPHRWLANRQCRILADVAEPLAESDRHRGLALAERSWRDRRHHHVLGTWPIRHRIDRTEVDLGGAGPVGLEQIERDACIVGDLGERPQRRLPGDLEVGRKAHRVDLCASRRIGQLSHTDAPHSAPRSRAPRWER
jgi:hypothetical protein